MKQFIIILLLIIAVSKTVPALPSSISILQMNYDRGDVKVIERFSSAGYYPERRIQPDSNYTIFVVSETDEVLYSARFSPPVKEYLDGSNGVKNYGGVRFSDAFNFSLIVPSFYNEREIVISEGGRKTVFELGKKTEGLFAVWLVVIALSAAVIAVAVRKKLKP
jgi:hypothetical protein